MASPKLFDYNSSFGVLRTNPKLTGNVKITLDSTGGVWLNSMNANPTLSSQKFKKYQVTGNLPYSQDIYNFFNDPSVSNDIIFQVGTFTDGEDKPVDDFEFQYDFFYGAGASTLIDRNYPENFKYFQPLWLRNELPEFFVIFKVPEPLSYPYSTNQTNIIGGKSYKVVQDTSSTEVFSISYGVNELNQSLTYLAGDIFTGQSLYPSYQILSGQGKIVEMTELKFQPEVNDVQSLFNSKILPNSSVIATFDLREETKIGKYIRSIVNDPEFRYAPVDFSFQSNTYTYYNGVSIENGVFSRSGELLYDYLISNESTVQSDFENYVTSGFSRNGIICASLLNLEFLFNDPDSDLYTINRYYGCYVSRNDLGNFRLNGEFFYRYKDLPSNLNQPKPSRDSLGYYNNNKIQFQSSTGGVRLFYEDLDGWLPGSYDVNVNDPQKLYYITDKADRFYSFKRFENYLSLTDQWENNTPDYATYGPYDGNSFGVTGNPLLTTGSLVIPNKSVDLSLFTGPGDKIGTYKGILPNSKGKANTGIEFLKASDFSGEIVFKIFWPNGTFEEPAGRYDLIRSGEFGGTLLGWTSGSSYNSGNYHYFNWSDGENSDFADSFTQCVLSIDDSVWDCARMGSFSAIVCKSIGYSLNKSFSVAVYDDYNLFLNSYVGIWNPTSSYAAGDIVFYDGKYFEAANNVSSATPTSPNPSPDDDIADWDPYSTFTSSGYLKIGDIDASEINGVVYFTGGTDNPLCRVSFSINDRDKIPAGSWIQVAEGTGVTGGIAIVESISRYVDQPVISNGAVTGFTGYEERLVANLRDQKIKIDLGSDSSFNVFEVFRPQTGVFSFFDLKDFDFDFWSSPYGETPDPEYHRYFELIPERSGQIVEGVKYFIRQGVVLVDQGLVTERTLSKGQAFIGSSVSSFLDIGLNTVGVKAIVAPAIFTQIPWQDDTVTYDPANIKAEENLDAFDGFYGIQSIDSTEQVPGDEFKGDLFNYGKLSTEYLYLKENYTVTRANRSKIVPYITKWGFSGGSDARGNIYRLDVSPAFSPTNFSPSFEKESPDPKYLTHEWMLLEGIPPGYPVDKIEFQQSYLPGKVDLAKIKSADPDDALYFSSFFTVDPGDYPAPYNLNSNSVKEIFSPFIYNSASGFYDTIFRGARISLKRRSTIQNPTSDEERFIPNYRGFEDYKFASVLRIIPETTDTIQAPVTYEVIENVEQKSILFVCNVVVKDYRALPLGYTGGTGGNPFVDYTLLYSIRDKKQDAGVGLTGYTGASGAVRPNLYEISDIKLSSALDLSMSSGSSVTPITNPGFIYTIDNPEFDTDLREEINLFYPPGGTGSLGLTGPGSFSVPDINSRYPWPTGRSSRIVNFGPIQNPQYTFTIPFAFSSPVIVPIGPRSTYAGNPVFQIEGGIRYFDFIIKRISLAQIYERVNSRSPYVTYTSYYWNPETLTTESRSDYFEIQLSKPTALKKPSGLFPAQSFFGPQTLGQNQPTSYTIRNGGAAYGSDILRYAGSYEPIFTKIFKFKRDKNDTITGYPVVDLSYRNCTFAPEKTGFGTIKNLNYSKVDLGKNILKDSQNLPAGPSYPLVGQTPIDRKNFSVFLSSWDPGYYNLYSSATSQNPVAGTRSMRENKSFLGSKMMQTPYTITLYTFIALEISRTSGTTDVQAINDSAKAALTQIQSVGPSNSNTGIGQLGTALSTVDLASLDERIYPDVEVFWQRDQRNNKLIGSIRLDRVLRRYLLNSGIDRVFVDNMISEFGVGDPNSIEDDIKIYIDKNIVPIYEAINLNLYVKKTGNRLSPTELLLRGDLINPDRVRYQYYSQENFSLTMRNELSYTFELPLEDSQNYSTTFSFQIQKI